MGNDKNKNKKKEEKYVRFNNIVNMSIIIMNNDCYNHDTNNKNNSNNNDSNGIGAQQQEQERQKVSDTFWYSQKDLEDFRKRNSDIAAGMAFGDIIEGDEHTYRGLELHDCRKCKKYRNTCYKVYRAVFLEQEKQLRKGVVDPNIIADVYKKNGAKECQNKAHRKGLLDYNDAYNRRCCDANALDNKNNNSNKTKPKKNLILKTSKIKM